MQAAHEELQKALEPNTTSIVEPQQACTPGDATTPAPAIAESKVAPSSCPADVQLKQQARMQQFLHGCLRNLHVAVTVLMTRDACEPALSLRLQQCCHGLSAVANTKMQARQQLFPGFTIPFDLPVLQTP